MLAFVTHISGSQVLNIFLTAIVGTILVLGASSVGAASHKETKERKKTDVTETSDMVSAEEAAKGRDKKKDRRREESRDQDGGDDTLQADKPESDRDKSANGNKGSERSQEMRARRDERKAIQEEYRSDPEPGQEGWDKEDGQSAKKPWWKFWGD